MRRCPINVELVAPLPGGGDQWCSNGVTTGPEAVSFWNPQSRSPLPYMPRYHFDVIGRNTIADRTGLLLPDAIHASDAADRLASELYEIRPELRVRECAVLVTDDDGEEVHRAPDRQSSLA